MQEEWFGDEVVCVKVLRLVPSAKGTLEAVGERRRDPVLIRRDKQKSTAFQPQLGVVVHRGIEHSDDGLVSDVIGCWVKKGSEWE